MNAQQKANLVSEYVGEALSELELAWHECQDNAVAKRIFIAIERLTTALLHSHDIKSM